MLIAQVPFTHSISSTPQQPSSGLTVGSSAIPGLRTTSNIGGSPGSIAPGRPGTPLLTTQDLINGNIKAANARSVSIPEYSSVWSIVILGAIALLVFTKKRTYVR